MASYSDELLLLLDDDGQASDPLADYNASVLATPTAPIFYAPLVSDTSTVIDDTSTNDNDGTYNGVTVQSTPGPVGGLAPFWDGANDYGNYYSASLASLVDFDEVTVMCWIKPASASVWTDGVGRVLFNLTRDGSNYIRIRKPTTNNTIILERVANGVTKGISVGSFSPSEFVCLTYSASLAGGSILAAGESIAYQNSVQIGSKQTANPAATNSGLSTTQTLLGAFNTSPALVWNGWLAHCAIWDTSITSDILALGTI